MPLPDERPRQSVANLIGRFEQQNKKQSSSAAPVAPRSSSVSSQIAGDSAKEETKEKREWPPKSVAFVDSKPSLTFPSSSTLDPALSPEPTIDIPVPLDVGNPAPSEPAKSPSSKTRASVGRLTPSSGTRRVPMSPTKARPSTVSTSPAKSLAKSPPPKTSLPSSNSQPLRPQHTGTSVASTASTARAPRTAPKTAPSTPSRPKTPAAHVQGTSRPKTPSSGLFAPTAASLARSRNALPPPPPVKKTTLSSSAAERLSKPTAASLSKARTLAPPVSSPTRVVKSISTGAPSGATSRVPSKLRDDPAPTRMKTGKATSMTKPTGFTEPAHEPDPPADLHVENGHEPEEALFSDPSVVEDIHVDNISEGTRHDSVLVSESSGLREDVPSPHEDYAEQPSDLRSVEEPAPGERRAQEKLAEEVADEHLQEGVSAVERTTESEEGPSLEPAIHNGGEEVETPAVPVLGNEIEDIVNLLEGTSISKPRPQSMISIPDEIPDEH